MKRYTLILADGSEDFRDALRLEFESFCTVHCCKAGGEVLEVLNKTHPDVLLLDLMLPEMDSISLLSAISALGDCPGILAVSSYVSPYIEKTAALLGVRFLMAKPCSLRKTEELLRQLLQSRDSDSQEDRFLRISGILLRLGFSAKLRGYSYLRDAVLQLSENPDLSIIKELYPQVAGGYGVSAEDVEHSIRSAAMDAWNHSGHGTWELYFGIDAGTVLRPSNAVMIQTLARSIAEIRNLPEAQMI